MQELIQYIQNGLPDIDAGDCLGMAEELLEREKNQITYACHTGYSMAQSSLDERIFKNAEDFYNKTFLR